MRILDLLDLFRCFLVLKLYHRDLVKLSWRGTLKAALDIILRSREPLIEVAQGVLERFELSDYRLACVGSTENIVYRVRSKGSTFALRIHRRGSRSVEAIEAELSWLQALHDDLALEIPQPVRAADGALVQRVNSPSGTYYAVLFRWLPGELLFKNMNTRSVRYAGAFVAELHGHSKVWSLPLDSKKKNDWKGRWRWKRDRPQAENLTTRAQTLCTSISDRLECQLERLFLDNDYGLVHGDLHPWNFLWDGRRIGAIDFDDLVFAPFLYDLAVLLTYLHQRRDYPSLKSAFIRGYSEVQPLPDNWEERLEDLMAIRALYIIDWVLDSPDLESEVFHLRRLARSLVTLERYQRIHLDI